MLCMKTKEKTKKLPFKRTSAAKYKNGELQPIGKKQSKMAKRTN